MFIQQIFFSLWRLWAILYSYLFLNCWKICSMTTVLKASASLANADRWQSKEPPSLYIFINCSTRELSLIEKYVVRFLCFSKEITNLCVTSASKVDHDIRFWFWHLRWYHYNVVLEFHKWHAQWWTNDDHSLHFRVSYSLLVLSLLRWVLDLEENTNNLV